MEKYKVIERSKDAGSTHSLLNKGMVPGIVYGKGTELINICLIWKASKTCETILSIESHWEKTIILLSVQASVTLFI